MSTSRSKTNMTANPSYDSACVYMKPGIEQTSEVADFYSPQDRAISVKFSTPPASCQILSRFLRFMDAGNTHWWAATQSRWTVQGAGHRGLAPALTAPARLRRVT